MSQRISLERGVMARGSEPFSWQRYPNVPRICALCARSLRVVDVVRVHTTISYASGTGKATSRFYCAEHVHEGYGE